ncbi:17241_t:CDS:2, partial [Acaulospora morrowiae]
GVEMNIPHNMEASRYIFPEYYPHDVNDSTSSTTCVDRNPSYATVGITRSLE